MNGELLTVESNPTATVYCYTPAGFKLALNIPMPALQDASGLDAQLQALGYLANAPGLDPGQQKETIATVMRRVHVNKDDRPDTPIIDFYPEWNASGSFGEYKYAHMYLNTPDDIAEFEAQSGLKLDDIPLYEGQAPLQRTFGKRHPKETAVKRPFEIVKTEIGKTENGMPKNQYSYFAPILTPEPNGASAPAQWADAETPLKIKSYAITLDLDGDAINAALEGDYTDVDWLNANWTRERVLTALNVYAENRNLEPAKPKGAQA